MERGGSSRISEKKKKEKKRIDSGTELNEIAVGPDAIQALRELFKSWGGGSRLAGSRRYLVIADVDASVAR